MKTRVLNAVISFEVNRGHLKWKVSDVARSAKVSRPLIYYYFGKSKPGILDECFNLIEDKFFGFTDEKTQALKTGHFRELVSSIRTQHERYPFFAAFYHKSRATKNPLNDRFVQLERSLCRNIESLFPDATASELKVLQAVILGLTSAPFISRSGVEGAISMLHRALKDK